MSKPVVLGGGDAVFERHTSRTFMGRDVIHLMHEYPDELERLCGGLLVDGYDRNPASSTDLNFKVCRDCFKEAVRIFVAKQSNQKENA